MSTKVFNTEAADVNKSKLLPQHPCRIIIAGPSHTGKTNLLVNLLTDKQCPYKIINLFYAVEQPKYDIIEEYCKKHDIAFQKIKGIPPPDFLAYIEKEENKQWPRCVVLDDVMYDAGKSSDVSKLYTAGSHHCNTTVISINQRIFTNNTQRLNADILYLFNFNSDKATVRDLFVRLEPLHWKQLFDAYNEVMKTPYAWFMIDLKSDRIGNHDLKYRPNAHDMAFIIDEEKAS